MSSDKGVKKEDLLKIKHADDIKNKLEQISKVDDAIENKILNKEGPDGKTLKEKINKSKEKYNFGALNILILPAIVQWLLNKSKDKDLKNLREEVKEKTDKLVTDITQTMYGDSKEKEEIRKDEIQDKYKQKADKIIDEFMEKKYADISEKINKGEIDISQIGGVVQKALEEINPSLVSQQSVVNTNINDSNKKKDISDAILHNQRQQIAEDLTDKKFENKEKLASAITEKLKKGEQVDLKREQLECLDFGGLKIDDIKDGKCLITHNSISGKNIQVKENGKGNFTLFI